MLFTFRFCTAISLMTCCCVSALAEDASDAIWLRQLIQNSGIDGDDVSLTLSGSGTVSVYLNGQRLVRNRNLASTQIRWNVASLWRSGRNCVAIASSAGTSTSLQLTVGNSTKRVKLPREWKGSAETPPVGWQQTDFNDRDWKKTSIAPPAEASNETTEISWAKNSGESRQNNGRFQFRDGDHVVLLGGTFIERAQQFGHLETALNSDSNVKLTFRNLGWSADTVFADSRGIFDSPEKGYERMIEHVRAEEPSVVIVCYGQNEAMTTSGRRIGQDEFRSGLKQLYADLKTTGAEIVFVSPHPLMPMSAPLPDPSRWNEKLQSYAAVVKAVAEEFGAVYVDLFSDFFDDMARLHSLSGDLHILPGDFEAHPRLLARMNVVWTANGMHWNDDGYRAAAGVIKERLFGVDAIAPTLKIVPTEKDILVEGGEIRNVEWSPESDTVLKFQFRPTAVSPFSPRIIIPHASPVYSVTMGPDPVTGLSEALGIGKVSDGVDTWTEYAAGINAPYDRLKALTLKKNELYFHRWRPQNITYLFGFRKHEQGNNASEIAMFDPLIDAIERDIQEAKIPVWVDVVIRQTK